MADTFGQAPPEHVPKLRVLVLGSGAVGSLYGGMLQVAGAEVSVVCRGDLQHARKHGLQIDSIWGKICFRPHRVYSTAAACESPPDLVLVSLKVLPSIQVPSLLQGALGPDTRILLLQNGVEIEPPIQAAFPEHEIISGLAFVCCGRIGPGHFDHLDYGRLTIGRFPGGDSAMVRRLAELWTSVGVPCRVTTDSVSARWHKLVWNAPFNPLSVLGGGVTTEQMLASAETAVLVRRAMAEVRAVALASGADLPADVIDRMLADTQKMKPYKTSMLLDYEAGRPMEVEAILGNAVRAARREKVDTPILDTMYSRLSLADQQQRRTES